jgi:hypothetical protein
MDALLRLVEPILEWGREDGEKLEPEERQNARQERSALV